jgi:small ligand-binding sensory domain FIST
MRWASSLSQHLETSQAVVAVLEQLHAALDGARPDLLLVWASSHHAPRYGVLARALRDAYPGAHLLGCGADSVIGAGTEIEAGPALAVAAARLPDVEIAPLRIDTDALAGLIDAPERARKELGLPDAQSGCVLLLGDPFSPGIEPLTQAFDRIWPEAVKLGAVASGASRPNETALFLDGELHSQGWTGLALSGRIDVQPVVAQGCRPVGNPMFVTRCRGNVLAELDGRPPMHILQELFEQADPRERALYRSSLFLGIEMRPLLTHYERGDFLVRNLIGGDAEQGTLIVAAPLEPKQVVQFHIRDAHTASEDLSTRLTARTELRERARAALLFSCLGRGRGLYGASNHDCDLLAERIGPLPVSGFFGNGEIGPVHGQTFLHSYTSVFGLVCEPE